MLTIVGYHYIRELERNPFPRLKALELEKFAGQLDYIDKHYPVVSQQDVARAACGTHQLPANAIWLTFDDGLRDHWEFVFPRLRAREMTASFFSSVCSVVDHRVLDVHKIHFMLAAVEDPSTLKDALLAELDVWREQMQLPTNEELHARHAFAKRFDGSAIVFVKRVLQLGVPLPVRTAITASLFARFVSADETAFAKQLYLNTSEMSEMVAGGMTIGGHGSRHEWLSTMSREQQEADVRATLGFLASIYGRPATAPAFCYPHGSYNATTLEVLAAHDIPLAVTTAVGLVDDLSRPLELQRIDTNDLPFDRNAPLCDWTRRLPGAMPLTGGTS